MSETFESMTVHLWNETFGPKRKTVSLVYDEYTDMDSMESTLRGFVNSGWNIGTVYVDTDSVADEEIGTDKESDIISLLDALIDSPMDAACILTVAELYSTDYSMFENRRFGRAYTDFFFMEGDSREDCAEKYHEEFEGFEDTGYLVIDWDETARQMEYDSWTFHERPSGTYLIRE